MGKKSTRLLAMMMAVAMLALSILACSSNSNSPEVRTPAGGNSASAEEIADTEIAEQPENEIVEATEIPQPTATKELGTSRSNPAPAGSEIIADDMAFVVQELIRPADTIIRTGNMFNTEPEENQEYVMVMVEVNCMKGSDDKCNISPFNFTLLGSKGVDRDAEWSVAGVSNILESKDFYGGSSVSGYLPFIIDKDEIDLLLVYEPLLFGDNFYLALPEASQAE